MNLNFLDRVSKKKIPKYQISWISVQGVEFFRADGRTEETDRQAGINDEAKSRFSQFLKRAKKRPINGSTAIGIEKRKQAPDQKFHLTYNWYLKGTFN